MPISIIPIVEGHGDVQAVPLLVRRIAQELGVFELVVGRPIRTPRCKIVRPGELERAVDLALRKGGRDCKILILLDAETDCPAELVPQFLTRVQAGARRCVHFTSSRKARI